MNERPNKAEWDFFVTALLEEARTVIWETGATVAPRDLVNQVLDELQDLAPRGDGHSERSEEQVWIQAREILLKAAYLTRPYCIRCGACCTKGSPTLLKEDLKLFTSDILHPTHVITIKEGETAYCNRTGQAAPAEQEMIKVRERTGGTTCIFYEKKGCNCSIYDSRPAQCRHQECWNPIRFNENPPSFLNRKDLLEATGSLWEIIRRHEDRCSQAELARTIARLAATRGNTVEEVLEILRFDHHVRQFVAEKFSLDPETMDFFFGRALRESINIYGLNLEVQPDGSFLLTQLISQKEDK